MEVGEGIPELVYYQTRGFTSIHPEPLNSKGKVENK
jgi:hypothetical protein